MPEDHPACPHFRGQADVFHSPEDLQERDLTFLISWPYKFHKPAYVIHESALPNGRGWSPLAHQILEGKNTIVFSMIEAVDEIDGGRIVMQKKLHLDGTELFDEIHRKSAELKLEMVRDAMEYELTPTTQDGKPTYYQRRTKKDSELDIDKTLGEQFNLLRICDPRFPAYFTINGEEYEVTLTKK